MALPVTISGAAYPKKTSFIGPFKSSGGAYYFVAVDSATSRPAVYKASDPTSSFAEVDSANRPASSESTLRTIRVLPDGDTLRIISASATDLFYHDFSMSSDTWGTKDV